MSLQAHSRLSEGSERCTTEIEALEIVVIWIVYDSTSSSSSSSNNNDHDNSTNSHQHNTGLYPIAQRFRSEFQRCGASYVPPFFVARALELLWWERVGKRVLPSLHHKMYVLAGPANPWNKSCAWNYCDPNCSPVDVHFCQCLYYIFTRLAENRLAQTISTYINIP